MQFTDRATIKGFRKTADGYLVGEAFAVRTGIQIYRASEVGAVGDGIVRVYRSEDQVRDPKSLATFSHAPITFGHPVEMVTRDNFAQYAKGEVSTEATWQDNKIRLPLIVKDGPTIDAIVIDEIQELSAGYTCDLDWTGGTTADGQSYDAEQKNIRVNHIAIVPRGRAGSECRIGDDATSWGASPVHVSDKGGQMADLRKIMVGDELVEVTDAAHAAITKLQSDLKSVNDGFEAFKTKAKAKEEDDEKEMAKKDAALAAADAAKLDDAALDARVAARADLITRAKLVAKDVATVGLSDAAIRKAAVVAALGDAVIAGKSDAYVDARFDILADDAAKGDPIKDAKTAVKTDDSLDAIYADRNKSLSDAWKGGK